MPALPVPEFKPQAEFREPTNTTERLLCDLFGEVLGQPAVGVDDGLFHLSGHSLLVARLRSRVQETLGADLPLRLIFEHSTVAGLAPLLATASSPEEPPITGSPRV